MISPRIVGAALILSAVASILGGFGSLAFFVWWGFATFSYFSIFSNIGPLLLGIFLYQTSAQFPVVRNWALTALVSFVILIGWTIVVVVWPQTTLSLAALVAMFVPAIFGFAALIGLGKGLRELGFELLGARRVAAKRFLSAGMFLMVGAIFGIMALVGYIYAGYALLRGPADFSAAPESEKP